MARGDRQRRLHGFLVVDKPAGWTSHDVVARIRRLTGERRVGHGGTLDPAATGVLPIAIGSATRVLEFLLDASKTYLADIWFGVSTDSLDIDGTLIAIGDASRLTAADVRVALSSFEGTIDQVPPLHSAIKVGGRRLYEYARRGEAIEPATRQVTIHRAELIEWSPPVAVVAVDCSKGTYIRALARDLGAATGTGAFLSNLVRVRSGPFSLCDAWTLSSLESLDMQGEWERIAIHPDVAVMTQPAVLLDKAATRRWWQGLTLSADREARGTVRAYDDDGHWVGVGRGDGNAWRPTKVIEASP